MTLALAPRGRQADRLFKFAATLAGLMILMILAGVAFFLTLQAIPGITASPGQASILDGVGFGRYVLPLVFGTLWAASIALLLALPLAVSLALFITQYAPTRIGKVIGYVVDLLAAIPSVVYGLWGITFLAGALAPIYAWLSEQMGWFWLFKTGAAGTGSALSVTGRTVLTAAIVLAVMILPIITAVCREVFAQVSRHDKEAALALGATRWEMIRLAVLPHGRSSIAAGAMLGLGRALGETMAVTMVLSATGVISFGLLSSSNPTTIPANIALGIKESSGLNVNVLIASGLVLFIITFIVNIAARKIASRSATSTTATTRGADK